jgi:acylphosphatase
MVVCKRVIYSGQVQGVGFRYTAQHLSSGLRVSGYVKNLPSRKVELIVEGEADQVEAFLERVAQRMAGHIHHADITSVDPQGFQGFTIRY